MNTRRHLTLAGIAFAVLAPAPALANGSGWTQVQPDGFGDPNNASARLVEFDGHLYAYTENVATGGAIFRTADGASWTPATSPGFGTPMNFGMRDAFVFDGALYMGTANQAAGGELWRTSDGVQWNPVAQGGLGNPMNWELVPRAEFGGALYAFTLNFVQGVEVWRSTDGAQWAPVNGGGFGDPGNAVVVAAQVFGGELYAGTVNFMTGGELWKTADGTNWTQVGTDGFGDAFTTALYPGATFAGELYVGTGGPVSPGRLFRSADGVTFTRVGRAGLGDPQVTELIPVRVRENELQVEGCKAGPGSVWRSTDGIDFVTAVPAGMGDGNNNCAYPIVFAGDLFVATVNWTTGAEVWRQDLAPLGTPYCSVNANSTGAPAVLALEGDASLGANCTRISASGAPAHAEGVFFLGGSRDDIPFGDGRLCIGRPLLRIGPPVVTSSSGTAELTLDYTRSYGAAILAAGGTAQYQFWYRDLASSGTGTNTTAAIEVVHTP